MNKNYEENYDRLKLIEEMENEFNNKNTEFFNELAFHHDPVIRTRSICIIAEIGGNEAVNIISKVLKEDVDELVRHEAAVALGVIGSEDARGILVDALKDSNEEVKKSAIVALANLDYIFKSKKINKFTRLTGG